MRRIVFIVSVCILCYCNTAKSQFRYDRQGRPVNELSYTNIDGDPYLVTDWTAGTVVLSGGKSVNAILKFDTYANRLLFQGKNSETMEFIDKLTGFTLNIANSDISNTTPLVFANNFPATDKQTEASWYQVIADGKVKLLKYYGKQTMESQTFNSASKTKAFMAFQAYYIVKNNQLLKTSMNKKAIFKILVDNLPQAETFIKANNINFKSDSDLQKFFTWYNSLN